MPFVLITKHNLVQVDSKDSYCKYNDEEFTKYGLRQFPNVVRLVDNVWKRIPIKYIGGADSYPEPDFNYILFAGMPFFDAVGNVTEVGRARVINIVSVMANRMKVELYLCFNDKDCVRFLADGKQEDLIYRGPE